MRSKHATRSSLFARLFQAEIRKAVHHVKPRLIQHVKKLFLRIGAFIEVFPTSMVQVPLPAEEIQLDADPIVLFLVMVLPNTVNLVGIIQKDVIGQYMTVLIHRIDVEEKPAPGFINRDTRSKAVCTSFSSVKWLMLSKAQITVSTVP